MDEQQRRQVFEHELAELQQKYGFQVAAQIQVKQLGPAYISEPVIGVIPIPGWIEQPILTPEEIETALHGNGRPHLEEVHKP